MPPYLNNIEYIQKGYQWLRDRMLIDESKVKHQLSTLKEKEGYERKIRKLETRLKISYLAEDILPIYVLSFFNDPIVEDFKKAANNNTQN